MPYKIKKVKDGYKVCKRDEPTKCFSKKGITKEQAIKQMKAIGLHSHKKIKGSGKAKNFNGQLVFFGVGAVAKATLHLLDDFIKVNPKKIFMFDLIDYSENPDVKKYIDKGAHYIVMDLNIHYRAIINKLNKYDIVIDLTCMTQSLSFMEECKKNNICYINTSLEDKESVYNMRKSKEGFLRTYQQSHNEVNELKKKYPENMATQSIINGMNPGLISSMIKYGLLFLALKSGRIKELKHYIDDKDYGKLCNELKVAVIHCSETDSSDYINKDDKDLKKFTNTWCINGFVQEGSANCEFTYGSDQMEMPKDSKLLHDHIIEMKEPAIDVFCESYVPVDGKIIGIVIPHSEGISSSVYFSDGTYCPTQHYVYKIAPVCHRSLKKFYPKNDLGKTIDKDKSHVLNNLDDDFEGIDRVGALILTTDKKAVWCGSMLDNKNEVVGNHSATTIQVACSLLSGVKYMIENPDEGILFPEDLDELYVINHCKKYLGKFYCDFVDYKPESLEFNKMRRTKEQFDKQYKVEPTTAPNIENVKGFGKKKKIEFEIGI